MKAVVYHGPGKRAWEEVPDATILEPTDVIARVDTTTICGTDLHILKGDVPEVEEGRILGQPPSQRSRLCGHRFEGWRPHHYSGGHELRQVLIL